MTAPCRNYAALAIDLSGIGSELSGDPHGPHVLYRGPRILAMPEQTTVTPDEHVQRARDEGKTGIRRLASGAWAAVIDGRLVDEWSGPGSKAQAIRKAGTNEVLS